MSKLKKLPIGIEDFAEIRREDFYYVDKTKLIEQLLERWGKANLFTRPRRFGKSLNMSMFRCFFETGTDPSLFQGLYISENQELCEQYMGKFPVISISLKGVSAESYAEAYGCLVKVINREARRFLFLEESERLGTADKKQFASLLENDMNTAVLMDSLRELTELLEKHYGNKVIVFIDEYDVPLAKANENGYYDEMVLVIRNLFENVLKTNESLKFAVLTGCLRVAKESIFTGLNNFNVFSITDVDFDEEFGFTDEEVRQMLHYYGQEDHYETVKEWYDGYRFGNVDVYCPWDVINYCSRHRSDPALPPENYWMNTSGNEVLNHFIDCVGEEKKLTELELEKLVNGECVQKEIKQTLTYKEVYSSIENLWSTLFMTGYLTQRGRVGTNRYNLAIPNREVRNIMTEHILGMFRENVEQDGKMVNAFCDALKNGKAEEVERIFSEYLRKTISVRDTFARKATKENFYHGILLGILSFKGGWSVSSNKESGEGFSDVLIEIDDEDIGIEIEVKYAENGKEEKCREALQQIREKNYADLLRQDGINEILRYGIACNAKHCRVMVEGE